MSIKINLDTTVLNNALKAVTRLAPPSSGNVTFEAKKGKLFIVSQNDTASLRHLVPSKIDGDGMFALPLEALQSASKGRKELACKYHKSMFHIKSGTYEMELATVDAIPMENGEEEQGKPWEINSDLSAFLKSSIAFVSLKPTAQTTAFMPISVHLTKQAGFVSCYDEHHMAFVVDKKVTGNLSFSLPMETLNAVLDTVQGDFKLMVGASTLSVKSKLMQVTLSLPADSATSNISVEDVVNQAREAMKADGKEVGLLKDDVLTFLDNSKAIATKERLEIKVVVEKGEANLRVETVNGRSQVPIKTDSKAKVSFNVDAEFFEEAVRKSGENVVFKVVDGSFLSFKTKNSYVIVSTNQD